MSKGRDIQHRAAFENQGETYVRLLAEKGNPNIAPHARAWLGEQQALREEAATSMRDEREERTLEIASKALLASEEANLIAAKAFLQLRWAKWSAIIATIAAITANKEAIFDTITILLK
jgi:hypothetical protein